MKILETPQFKTLTENKKEKQNIQFKGTGDYISLGLRFLDTNQAWGANAVDVGSMVLPRTTVDFINRGPAAGMETGRREASGTINHSLIGVYGSLAALAFSLALNKTFNVRADKIFADNESFDIIGKYFHDNIHKNKDNALGNTLDDVLKNLSTTVGNEEKKLSEYDVDVVKKRLLSALTSSDIDQDTIPKSTKQYLVNYIIQATGSESDYKLKAFGKETSNNLSTFVENLYNISKTLTKEKVVEEFEKVSDFSKNKFIKGIKNVNNRRTVVGMAIASGVGMSIQPLNIYLTKKKTGSDGFVGVEGREKDNSFGFKLWKLAAAVVFGGGIIADLARKEGGLLKNTKNPKRCECSPNCYYKQLARKTHECNELKIENEELNNRMAEVTYRATGGRLSYSNYTLDAIEQAFNDQLEILSDQKVEEEIKELNQKLYLVQNEVHFKTEYIQEQREEIKQLEQECEELKRKVELMMDCADCKVDKYKQALDEIEKELKEDIYCENQECGCDDFEECLKCTKEHILDIINKAKGEGNV